MSRRDDIVSQQELQRRAAELAGVPPVEDTPEAGSALLIVTVDGTRLGLELSMVREVVAHPAVTPLPLTPPCIAGIVNLRYEILAALDLAALRGDAPGQRRDFAVIVQDGDRSAAVLVDAIEEVAAAADRRTVPVVVAREVLHHPDLLPFSGEVIG